MGKLSLVKDVPPQAVHDDEVKAVAAVNTRRAYDLLVRKYREKIFYHAFYILKDAQEAFDVTQEVFIRSYQEPKLFCEDFRIKPWLFRVCTNLCYNIVRDKKRRGGILETVGEEKRGSSEVLLAVDAVLDREMSRQMARALHTLPLAHRNILLLRYWDDLSYAEIAEVLGVKMGTVMSRLSRAKSALSEVLAQEQIA
ncbi:RNA polymerase sigma factor [Myxococcota bacterium]|nr:RNA polymerase sigma factor [Myxococcota bacterium]